MGRQAQDAKRDREVDLAGGRGIPFSLSLSAATDLCDRIEAFWRRLLDRFTEAVADIESRLVSEERAERLRERIQVIRELLEEDLTLLEDVLADTLDDLPEGAASAKAEVLRLGVRRRR